MNSSAAIKNQVPQAVPIVKPVLPVIFATGNEYQYIKMLLYGSTGSGKTWTSTHLDQTRWGNILYVNLENKDASVPLNMMQARVGSRPESAREELILLHDAIFAGEPGYTGFDVIVLDGMSEFAENVMDEIKFRARSGHLSASQATLLMTDAQLGLPGQGAWGKAGDTIRNIFKLFKSLPCHVIFTATEEQELLGGKLQTMPYFYGKSQKVVPHFVSYIGHTEPATNDDGTTIYRIRFVTDGRGWAKQEYEPSRGNPLDPVEPADLNTIFEKILKNKVKQENIATNAVTNGGN